MLNDAGKVIGVTVSEGPGENLSWAIPANDLDELLEKQLSSPEHLDPLRDKIINSSDFKWLDSDYPS